MNKIICNIFKFIKSSILFIFLTLYSFTIAYFFSSNFFGDITGFGDIVTVWMFYPSFIILSIYLFIIFIGGVVNFIKNKKIVYNFKEKAEDICLLVLFSILLFLFFSPISADLIINKYIILFQIPLYLLLIIKFKKNKKSIIIFISIIILLFFYPIYYLPHIMQECYRKYPDIVFVKGEPTGNQTEEYDNCVLNNNKIGNFLNGLISKLPLEDSNQSKDIKNKTTVQQEAKQEIPKSQNKIENYNIGDHLGDLILYNKENTYKFAGQTVVSGVYFREKIYFSFERVYKEKTCIELDDSSYLKLPYAIISNTNDYSERLLCFNETERVNNLIGVGSYGKGSFLIGNYTIFYHKLGDINQYADLLEIVEIKETHLISDISTWESYKDDKYGYSFKINPRYFIYSLSLNSIEMQNRGGTISSIVCSCGESGSAVRINIWDNKENLELRDWINEYLESKYPIEEPKEVVIGGVKGLKTEIGEMGGGPIIAIKKDGLIFEIRAYFLNYSSEDYRNFINSFVFTK